MKGLTEKERQALKELVEELKKLYDDNLSKVILYGSKARGDATEDSDIDVLVVLKNVKHLLREKKKIRDIGWEVCYKYDLLISIIVKTEDEYLLCDTPLLMNVQKEGIFL